MMYFVIDATGYVCMLSWENVATELNTTDNAEALHSGRMVN